MEEKTRCIRETCFEYKIFQIKTTKMGQLILIYLRPLSYKVAIKFPIEEDTGKEQD